MLAHADDDVRSNIVGCVTVCAILSVIFVGTRLFARWLHRNTLLLADYLIIFALVRHHYLPANDCANTNTIAGRSVSTYLSALPSGYVRQAAWVNMYYS